MDKNELKELDKANLKAALSIWVKNEILIMIKEVVVNQDSTRQKELADSYLNKIVDTLTEGK